MANRIDSSISRQRAAFYFPILARYITKGSSVVDVGAGDGSLAHLISEKLACKCVALEVKSSQDESGDYEVTPFNGRDIPLADSSVDVSLSVSVVHHAEDPDRLLREIQRVTTKQFLLVEDHYESWLDRFMTRAIHLYLEKAAKMPFNRKGHSNIEGWKQRLHQVGFRVVEVRPLELTFFLFLPSRSVLLVCERLSQV